MGWHSGAMGRAWAVRYVIEERRLDIGQRLRNGEYVRHAEGGFGEEAG
jgi:hypothetical protein